MYRPSQEPTPSTYFHYEIFPYERPPEMDSDTRIRHSAVIIGAGPAGLVLAIQLARHGVKPVVIDSKAQVSHGSRAVALTKRSMEIIEQCGVADAFRAEAITWQEGRSYYKNRVVHELKIPSSPDDKFSPMTNLAQCVMEKILIEKARELGVEFRFQTLLVGLEEGPDAVTLTLDTADGEYQLEAEWVAACDGGRSAVRKLQNLRFEGTSFESRFVIADFYIELHEPAGRRCYFDPPWMPPGHSALVHKTPNNVWRLDYQVPDDVSDEEAMDPQRIASHIQAHLDYIGVDLPWKIDWVTLYKPNSLTLASYNHGRVLYCGDAAHLLPVFGVRGMNTGIQDSINLGWKLAAVIHNKTSASILDTYSTERVADARQICVEAGRSTRMMVPPTRGFRTMQRAVLSLSLKHEYPRDLLHWRTSHPIDYAESPLTVKSGDDAFTAGPRSGAPARNARLDTSSEQTRYLIDSFAPAFNILVFGSNSQLWNEALEDVQTLKKQGLHTRLIAIRSDNSSPEGADVVLHDTQGNAQALWGAEEGAVYVVRPDQHVLARWKAGTSLRASDLVLRTLQAEAHH